MTVFGTRLTIIALLGVFGAGAWGQGPAGSLLVIDTANRVAYARDVADYSLLATKPGATTAAGDQNFGQNVLIGDIVSVNGTRVKGTVLGMTNEFKLRPDAPPGMAIADTRRNSWEEWYFEILHEDGWLLGSIRVSGLGSVQGFPNPPPGQTSRVIAGSHVVVGGNGAFLGVRGYMGAVRPPVAARVASMAEDPANRRVLGGGGTFTQGIYILPMFRPNVVSIAGGPAIVHSSDFSQVTAQKPARPGEVLTLFASGLGPTRPGVEPGEPFPADPLQVCNSPIEVLVNGKSGEVLYAGGYPGAVDRYQVNFRVPDGIASGLASVQLTSAWIQGPEVQLPVE
jgi:uncharacterized protein (TIGR03437 family)